MEQEVLDRYREAGLPFLLRYPRSIRGRLIALTVGLFVLFMWILVYVSQNVLQDHFDELLLDQQFAATQQVAAELETKLEERIQILSRTAELIPAGLGVEALDAFLAQRTGMHVIFSAGIAVIGLDGKTIADYPVIPGRRGTFFGDRDYFRQVLATKKPYIDKPIIGRALKRPVLTIAVPVFDAAGNVRAVMTGITDLTAPNFLGNITDRAMTGKGEFFVLSRHDRIFVAATDKREMLEAMPERGSNTMLDRYVDGFEGSGFGIDAGGVPMLYSGKSVPTANWVVLAALPEDIARSPVMEMQRYVYAVALVITLLAVFLLWSMTQRILAPLAETASAMRRMTAGEIPLATLPVPSDDEVGQLIGNFNRLVVERQRYEAELTTTNQELQAFTYAASHDMKGPLGRINSFSGLLERNYRRRLEGNGLLFLDLIRRNAKRLMALVEDLLFLSQIDQKIMALHSVSLRETVEGVLEEYKDEIQRHGAEVRLNLTDVALHANHHGLAQVLRNLLENALKYSAGKKGPMVEIGNQVHGDRCRIWVKDNGIGFDMAYHDSIFEVFRRLHTYEEFPGSGIGLALAKKAIERMEGRVWAESEAGKGATFFLELRTVSALAESQL